MKETKRSSIFKILNMKNNCQKTIITAKITTNIAYKNQNDEKVNPNCPSLNVTS